jgi:hypothetical protein
MNTAPIRKSMPRKPPAKRLFSGVVGPSLAQVNIPASLVMAKMEKTDAA